MPLIPTLTTERLLLRPFTPGDAPAVHEILRDREVARTTAAIPHPYPDGAAEGWIRSHAAAHDAGEAVVLAIVPRPEGPLAGSVELRMEPAHRRGELGFWLGSAYWGRGYATEAVDALVRWGIHERGLHRVQAVHMSRNPASGAVLRKAGLRHEGTLRGHLPRWGVLEDVEVWAVLEDELEGAGNRE